MEALLKTRAVLARLDARGQRTMARLAPFLSRVSLGIVFIWFGALKPLGMSPAADLVARTVYSLDPAWFVPLLGWWEVAIGACFIVGGRSATRVALAMMALQLPGTFLPVVLLPDVVFDGSIVQLTMEGQYILKNLVLVSAASVVWGNLRPRGANDCD